MLTHWSKRVTNYRQIIVLNCCENLNQSSNVLQTNIPNEQKVANNHILWYDNNNNENTENSIPEINLIDLI